MLWRSTGTLRMCNKIAVRMDDITPDMNWDNFRFFQRLFQEAGITPLLGIVPDNQDPKLSCGGAREDFYEVMKQLKDEGYSLAMHGFRHVYSTRKGGLFPLNDYSEFAGLPYDEQEKMLALGRDELRRHGIETDIFMAPAHSYDKNTIKALKAAGFTRITDGFGKRPYRYKGMTFYPISFMMNRSLKRKRGATTIVLHANTVTDEQKERYRRIFKEYGKNMISYSEYLSMEPSVRHTYGAARCAEYLLAKCKFMLVRMKGNRSA